MWVFNNLTPYSRAFETLKGLGHSIAFWLWRLRTGFELVGTAERLKELSAYGESLTSDGLRCR
jgi:hypothetical protein